MPLNDQQIQALGRDAVQRAAAGDFAAAEAMFSRIVDERPNAGQALHFLGQVRLKLGRFAEAREPLERAAKFMPREPAAQTNLAGCLMQLGQHEAALEALGRAALLKPNDPTIPHNTGRTLEALGRLDDAERAYDLALSIDNRLLPSLAARANLLAARGEWAGALADLDTALVSRPNDPQLRLRRGELLLHQGDWWRGLADHEARLEIAGERYTPTLPRWQGEPLSGPLLLYPEQADIEGDDAKRDTIMLARGIDPAMTFAVQCAADLVPHLVVPTVRRGDPVAGFAAAAPLRSLPHLLGWTLDALPPPTAMKAQQTSTKIGWYSLREPPAALEVERDPAQASTCRLVVGDDVWAAHLAASVGIRTVILLPRTADWLWGPRLGTSPWYASVELLAEDDSEGLAARLAGC